jgi:aspartate/methionine/tyrosine aminotransferase
MKRYVISTVAVLVVLAMVWVTFGQEQGTRQGTRQGGQGRGGFMTGEQRTKAIEAIEAQLAKLKEGGQMPGFNRESFQNMSEDERAKFREKMMAVRQEQQKSLQIIMAQLATLEGRREPAPEGARYLIIATTDLKPIQDSAVKEKATETAKLIEGLVARGSGRGFGGGRRPGSGAGGGAQGARTRGGNSNR